MIRSVMANTSRHSPYLEIAPEVAGALADSRPVVALESTIIAHGMPYPRNVETARQVESAVRAEGAVPATIAVLDGRLRVGLDEAALKRIGQSGEVAKVSRRDLAIVLARGRDGATTVAATMIVAHLAGISVFVTGGIGGVHRGASETFDVSADLQELARTPVAVVCAGAKAILDLGLTLEYLETHGVPVLGHGTDRFPAFYTRDSGFGVDERVDEPAELAAIVHGHWQLGLGSGLVVANPIPEQHAMDPAVIDAAIERALTEADERGLRGKEITPFLLDRVQQLTTGDSLEANIALVLSNARCGARLSRELAALD